MSTVGYGDITPQNSSEALFVVFAMLFSSIAFAYSLNTTGLIINEITSKRKKIEDNMAILNNYLNSRKIKPELQQRVRKYLLNFWRVEEEKKNEIETKLIQQLNSQLLEELQGNIYLKLLSRIPIFNHHFSKELLLELSKIIEEHRVVSN